MPAVRSGGFTWGYGEKDIFKKGFEVLASAGSKPRLDIYLTLAMHDPYLIPNQTNYNDKVVLRAFVDPHRHVYKSLIQHCNRGEIPGFDGTNVFHIQFFYHMLTCNIPHKPDSWKTFD